MKRLYLRVFSASFFLYRILKARPPSTPGVRVSGGRHYFGYGGVILACFDPRADGDDWDATPNPDHVYLAVSDLEAFYERVSAHPNAITKPIETQPWGERSFYCNDPYGNKLCFVDDGTLFTVGLISPGGA